jgi:hypothetical protein
MSVETRSVGSPSKSRLLLLVVLAAMLATLLFVAVILPAEYHKDPTGFGRVAGLDRLAGPKQVTVAASAAASTVTATKFYATPFRSDFVDIALSSANDNLEGSELEYKVKMKAGDSLIYSWTAPDITDPEEFYFDFHGESPPAPEVKVVEYLQSTGKASNGMLVAPMDGVHGWYLQNQSAAPVVVRLKLSGFYELIPPGEHGNEARVVANKHLPDPAHR